MVETNEEKKESDDHLKNLKVPNVYAKSQEQLMKMHEEKDEKKKLELYC